MDDRSSNIPSKGRPPPLIDEGARFYDWRGHALTGEERRARLAAFRAGIQEAAPAAPVERDVEQAPPSSDAAVTATTLGLTGEPSVEVDAEEKLGATDSVGPVAAEQQASGQRRIARPLYMGLMAAAAALIASAAAGLFEKTPPASPDRRGMAQTPPRAALPDVRPPSTVTAPAELERAPSLLPPTSSSAEGSTAPAAAAAEDQLSPAAAASNVPGARGDLPPTPSRERVTPSSSSPLSPNVVPNDTPKF
jgi:hypothetical protein